MKRGQKHAPQSKPAPAIPPHIAALEIVKSVRPDGSYVCIHDQELTECDDCGPIALLADEETQIHERRENPVAGILDAVGEVPLLASSEFDLLSAPLPNAAAAMAAPAAITAPEVRPVLVPDTMPEDLSVACAALGIAGEHVLTHAIRGDGSVSIITRGGARLRWPCSEEQRQAALALTDQQRDGLIRDGEGNILPRGKWLTTPHTF